MQSKLSIIFPMAGEGKRFAEVGYEDPKPFIDVHGKPMIHHVLHNMPFCHKAVFLVRNEHVGRMKAFLSTLNTAHYFDHYTIIPISETTQGAACTVSLARTSVDPEAPLIVANSDQWIDWEAEHFYAFCMRHDKDGVIPVFSATDSKWSYAETDAAFQRVTEVKEKQPTKSQLATCGVYYFKQAKDCFGAIDQMVINGKRVNGEFYLAPCYNEMIAWDREVVVYPVPAMVGLGTPQDLNAAIDSGILKQWWHCNVFIN